MSEAEGPTGCTPGCTNRGQGERSGRNGRLNWTVLLDQAGIPDAPGYQECLAKVRSKPKPVQRKKGKRR